MRARAWCGAALLVALAGGCAWDWDRLEPPRDAVATDATDAADVTAAPDVTACPGTLTRCEGSCVDTQTDVGNCGGCGQRCRRFGRCFAGACH